MSLRVNHSNLIGVVICGIIVASLGIATYYRNEAWQSVESLWSDNLKKSQTTRVRINYAAAMMQQGCFEEAIYELTETLKNDPQSAEAMNNLAMIYTFQDRTDEAEKMLFRAIRASGSTAKGVGIAASAHNNLGVIMVKKGAAREALGHFKKAVELKPDFKEARENLKLISQAIKPKGGNGNGKN